MKKHLAERLGALCVLLSYLFFYYLEHFHEISVCFSTLIYNSIHRNFPFDKFRIIYLIIQDIPCVKFARDFSLFRNNSNFHIFTFNSFFPMVGS